MLAHADPCVCRKWQHAIGSHTAALAPRHQWGLHPLRGTAGVEKPGLPLPQPAASHAPLPPSAPSSPAGAVTYKTDNFLTKNRDFVVAEHQALLGASSEAFVRGLFPPDDDAGPGAGPGKAQSAYKFASVGSRFKRQLGDLMDALHRMEPHYIRCIKPNSFNRPMDFENMNVLHQVGPRGGAWTMRARQSSGVPACRFGRPAEAQRALVTLHTR